LFDVVDGPGGDDASIRPNQLLAVSLPGGPLPVEAGLRAVVTCREELLTPLGLRSLSPRDPAYQGRYGGNVVARDRAYHNGCVFPWLIGPFVTAHLKVNGRGEKTRAAAMKFLDASIAHIRGNGLGHLRELFEGDAPHAAKAGIASLRNTAEILRAYVEEILDLGPRTPQPTPPTELTVAAPPKLAAKR
ncbi:MAG TPA: amylo-alpha-1,6-glucosidase, partial [Burkholderiales bacterium]|nr:amylo-alpha-1,6-glucosidase [Burkholderiales bacterium]